MGTTKTRAVTASIIINNYNYGRFVREAIQSALDQDYPHVEVVVVDDGSTDDSKEVIESFGSRIIAHFQENQGQTAAMNAGFLRSTGDLIFFLDSDDAFLPGKVARIVQELSGHPLAQWVFHPLQFERSGAAAQAGPSTSHVAFSEVTACDFRKPIQRKGLLQIKTPATSGLAFKRDLLDRIFPIPTEIRPAAADGFIKFSAIGLAPGVYLPTPLAIQKIHGANIATGKDNPLRRAEMMLLTAAWMRRRFPELALFSNRIASHEIAAVWKSAGIRSKGRAYVSGYLKLIRPRERMQVLIRAAARRWLAA